MEDERQSRLSEWSVGTKGNPRMFSNDDELSTARVSAEIARTNHVRSNRNKVKLPNYAHSIDYDWKNDAIVFWASVDYIRNVLQQEPVIDTGDKEMSDYLKAVDSTDYSVEGVVY